MVRGLSSHMCESPFLTCAGAFNSHMCNAHSPLVWVSALMGPRKTLMVMEMGCPSPVIFGALASLDWAHV